MMKTKVHQEEISHHMLHFDGFIGELLSDGRGDFLQLPDYYLHLNILSLFCSVRNDTSKTSELFLLKGSPSGVFLS